MAKSAREEQMWRIWLLPFSLLLGVALAIFGVTFLLDAFHHAEPGQALRLIFDPNPESAANTLSNSGEVVAAVLAIAITVVAIVVELAANRYTHRITELFVAEPINFVIMGFFVVTALQSLWVALVFDYDVEQHSGFVPHIGIMVSMGMLALSLLILLPYFGFVFAFLNPIHIVDRIRKHTIHSITRRGDTSRRQLEAVRGIEQIADVGLNAMEHKDKGVSMASVNALRSMVEDYQGVRRQFADQFTDDWYALKDQELAKNPDFVSMSETVLENVSKRKIWFEMKVLRQYQTIYNEALNRMRDINYIIAINTRYIGEAAMDAGHDELVALTIKFFNTYLRATVNAHDIRTAYNILYQYRLLAEHALKRKDERAAGIATDIAEHFKYYGLISFHANLPFILETVAYDLCKLNQLAFELDSDKVDDLLEIFLQVDKESAGEIQEVALRGVRKAQIQLATYYLEKRDQNLAATGGDILAASRGEALVAERVEALAYKVFDDMKNEQPARLVSIRKELMAVKEEDFWEISDRGENFYYLSQEGKVRMLEFFGWFEDKIPPSRASQLVMDSGDLGPMQSAPNIVVPPAADGGVLDVPGMGMGSRPRDDDDYDDNYNDGDNNDN